MNKKGYVVTQVEVEAFGYKDGPVEYLQDPNGVFYEPVGDVAQVELEIKFENQAGRKASK
jgi:hypothetical protein